MTLPIKPQWIRGACLFAAAIEILVNTHAQQPKPNVAKALADGVEPIYLPPGAHTLPTLPNNPLGLDITGPGALMVPVDPKDPAKGTFRYVYPENDRYQRTFGEEYLYALHLKWKEQDPKSPPIIYLDGDSTIKGDYITDPAYLPQNIMLSELQLRGLDAKIINLSYSGHKIEHFHLSDDDIRAATCIIISFGINDTTPVEKFVKTYRDKLAHIRSLRSYMQTTVVIKTSNAVADTTHFRDETQAWAQRKALRQAARDFQCFYFDTAAYIADTRNGASGTWNDDVKPSTPITPGWMDDPFRSDKNWHQPPSFGNTVHPLEIGNAWIWGHLADALAVPGVRRYSANSFQNLSSLTPRDGNDAPNAYFRGLTINAANGEAGHWPAEGMVMSVCAADGIVTQYLTSSKGGASRLVLRVSDAGADGKWGAWATPGGDATVHTTPELQNNWKDNGGDGGVRIVKQGETVFLQGDISDGTIAPGTELFVLPVGYRPFHQRTTVVCAGGSDRDELVVLMITADGVVTVQKPPKNPRIYLDSVSFVTKQAFDK